MTNPWETSLWVAGAFAALSWTLSLISKEYSWVDRSWSIAPVIYLWLFAAAAGLSDVRLDAMAILVTLWGARLTFNFARKGGYAKGGEDYRWAVLRAGMRPWQFQLFNLAFISGYQNVILLAISLPAATAYGHRGHFGLGDVVAAMVFMGLLVGETIADEQQWRFQCWKKSELAAGRKPSVEFLQARLFRTSRHPNYFFEIAQWWVIVAFGAIAAGSPVQWTALGAVMLTLLFVGSTAFTEKISNAKYPGYADYQRATSAIVPWFPVRAARHIGAG